MITGNLCIVAFTARYLVRVTSRAMGFFFHYLSARRLAVLLRYRVRLRIRISFKQGDNKGRWVFQQINEDNQADEIIIASRMLRAAEIS